MTFWISPKSLSPSRRLVLVALVAFLGLCLTACGNKSSMAGASDDQSATVHTDSAQDETPTPTSLQGSEDTSTASEKTDEPSGDDSKAKERASHIPSGSTRSGAGKLTHVTVRAGDTLWKIAERPDVYGSGWLYPLIYKANKAIIKDANNLPAGLVLQVPRDIPDPEVEKAKEEAMTGQFLEKVPTEAVAAGEASPSAAVQPTVPMTPPAPAHSSSSGRFGWILLLILLAAVAVVAWMRLHKDSDAI